LKQECPLFLFSWYSESFEQAQELARSFGYQWLGGGGKGMRAVGRIYLKHGMELVKNLLLLGMMECILKN
jgi:hypothetical protein